MNYLISMFIDDELDLDEKMTFVETIYGNQAMKDESMALLFQEKQLRSRVVERIPEIRLPEKKGSIFRYFRPVPIFSAVVLSLILFFIFIPQNSQSPSSVSHRFVIYRPQISQAEIAGSFTNWQPVPMTRLGSSGYWEIVLDLPQGEHRFSYILEGEERMPDPTILIRESDDFGGENSILNVKA
jgi:hypothetical protein